MEPLDPSRIRLMQGLAQRIATHAPWMLNADATVGELAWVWAKGVDTLGRFWRHRLWIERGRLVAWGWAHLPRPATGAAPPAAPTANLTWQTDPDDRPERLHDILHWFDTATPGMSRTLTVQSADTASQPIVAAHGYTPDPEEGSDTGSWSQFNIRPLEDIPAPALPPGFRFVTAAGTGPAGAVRAHRDAWHRSTFTEAAFGRVRDTWPYRADLHVLVQAPDGTLAATAIIWLDPASRTAEFEPVGTHPAYRRRGLGTALQLHGMHQARGAGATRMLVACRGAPAHPAARGLYEGVGFRMITRDLPQIKPAG